MKATYQNKAHKHKPKKGKGSYQRFRRKTEDCIETVSKGKCVNGKCGYN